MLERVNAKTAKELKEAGFPQEGCSAYIGLKSQIYLTLYPLNNGYLTAQGVWRSWTEFEAVYAQPSGEEILHTLPRKTSKKIRTFWLCFETQDDSEGWAVGYRNINEWLHFIEDRFLAEASASLWQWCKRKGFMGN